MNDIYEQVILKQNELIGGRDDKNSTAEKMDELLTLLMDNFTGDVALEKVTPIFHYTEDERFKMSALGHVKCINTMDIESLKALDTAVVPVAVVRYILAIERIVVDPARCPSFDRFTEAYADIILQA